MVGFLTKYGNVITTVIAILGLLGLTSIAGVIRWFIQRRQEKKQKLDVGAFEVLTDPSTFLARCMRPKGITAKVTSPNQSLKQEVLCYTTKRQLSFLVGVALQNGHVVTEKFIT